jgi:hypothetical protein
MNNTTCTGTRGGEKVCLKKKRIGKKTPMTTKKMKTKNGKPEQKQHDFLTFFIFN